MAALAGPCVLHDGLQQEERYNDETLTRSFLTPMVVPNLRQLNPRYAVLAGFFIVVGGFYLVQSIRPQGLSIPTIPSSSSSSPTYALKPIDQNNLRGALQRSHIRYEKMLKARVGYLKEYGDQLKANASVADFCCTWPTLMRACFTRFPFYRTFSVCTYIYFMSNP